MKNLVMLLLIISFMFGVGFRGNDWGVRKLEVKEKTKIVQSNEDTVIFSDKINDYDVTIVYDFYNGTLYQGNIIKMGSSETLYQYLKNLLEKKYGKSAETILDDDYNQFCTLEENYNYGFLFKFAEWDIKDTKIKLIAGDNIVLIYTHSPTEEIIQKEKEKNDKSLL